MKKLYITILSLVCLCTSSAYAWHNPLCKKQQSELNCRETCPQTYTTSSGECFLCTKKNMNSVFSGMNLSNAQICNANKIQEKYEQEVLSLNDRLECENKKLCELKDNCAKSNDIRKQKRAINELEKTKKKICECYEKQFKATLSDNQISIYNKNKK